MKISVIVATRNEGFYIGSTLKRLRQISQAGPLEIIVVDGRSDDETAAAAKDWADQVVMHERPNRGEQFHIGARKASGEFLLFLRGDAQLHGSWQQTLEHFWLSPRLEGVAATAFTVEYGAGLTMRMASFLSNASVRWRGKASDEHGLCTTADIYRHSGGFPPYPCLEDLAFCERLRPFGRVVMLPELIWPSARRLHRLGVLRCAAGQLWREWRFALGGKPEDIGSGQDDY